jgi:V-type H+-transporting ATPase subunit C
MQPTQYILVSLPLRIFDDDPLAALTAAVGRDNGETLPFSIPSFKIGTLDALVQHADDLAKLNAACEAAVAKVADSLKGILDGDEDKTTQQKMVNDSRLPRVPSSPLSGLRVWLTAACRAHRSLSAHVPME